MIDNVLICQNHIFGTLRLINKFPSTLLINYENVMFFFSIEPITKVFRIIRDHIYNPIYNNKKTDQKII
jgi:hypothetical protein